MKRRREVALAFSIEYRLLRNTHSAAIRVFAYGMLQGSLRDLCRLHSFFHLQAARSVVSSESKSQMPLCLEIKVAKEPGNCKWQNNLDYLRKFR
jgi:hypothetical protein